MRGFFGWFSAGVVALGACAGQSESGSGNDGGANGSATGGASGNAGGTSGSATGGASGSGGIPDVRRCEVPSDCALVAGTCCLCGVPELEDLTAINAGEAAEWSRALCAMEPPCGCPSAMNPNLVATCESGTCVAIDVREHAVSECSGDTDCLVRATECCECGASTDPENLIAVGQTGGYQALVCDPMTGCPECIPFYPPEVAARCAGGHCALVAVPQ